MTIYSTISIFIIFMLCNVMQLILIHAFTSNQEEEQLNKRSKEISTLIDEQYKLGGIKAVLSEDFFENIIGQNEMIRILDQQGQGNFLIFQRTFLIFKVANWNMASTE